MIEAADLGETLVTLTAEIVAAHVSNNTVAVSDLPVLIQSVHEALCALDIITPNDIQAQPAVSIRASVQPDYIVCLEDGRKMKTLKRHLRTEHGLTPNEYRQKWGLDSTYPLIARNYAERRSKLAKEIGLGRKTGKKT